MRIALAIVVLFLAACGGGGSAAPAAVPTASTPAASSAQAFALMDPSDGRPAFDAALAGVDGIAVRTSWSALAPARGSYDWSVIDAASAAASAQGKKFGLHIVASGYATPPTWLPARGMQTYSYTSPQGATVTDAVPWDGVFLAEWAAFVQALGAHLAGNARLHYVSVAVPVPEMSLPGCANGRLGTAVAYDRARYRDAWKASIQALANALPGVLKLLPVPVATICRPDADGPALYQELFEYARGLQPQGFAFYATDLDANGSRRLDGIAALKGSAPVALQYVGAQGAQFAGATCAGTRQWNAALFEVYKGDLGRWPATCP